MIDHRLQTVLRNFIQICFVVLLCVLPTPATNKDDVVVLKNGDRLTGEIKGLQRGELRVKADYMAEAVRLDWARIERIESKSTFMIYLVDGKIFTSVVRLLPANSGEVANFVIGSTRDAVRVPQDEVIRILPIEAGFFKRLEGSIDFGLSFTSGNDQYETDLAATTTYRTGDHLFTTAINSTFNGQTDGESTRRNQFVFDYRKQLNERYYTGAFFELLRSDQQSLNLRTTIGGLLGRSMLQTENMRLSLFGGAAGTREHYAAELGKPTTTNADAVTGVDFYTFRFTTVDVRSRFSLFPSLTTPGRMRVQAASDMRIKLAKDLYWGFHLYENFDSKPPVRAEKNDLGISTSLGWKF